MTDARSSVLSEDVFRRLLESMSEGVVLTGEDGVILYANPAMCRMFRYDPDELIGVHVRDLNGLPLEAAARRSAEVIQAMTDHGGWRGEWLQRRKDGTEFLSSIHISAVDLDGGRHWFSVQEDVTEQRRVQDALTTSERRLELAAGAADIGVWDWDLITGQVAYSQQARRIYGFSPDRPITMEMARAVQHPEDQPRVLAQTARAMDPAIREKQAYEFRIVRPDGELRWIAASGEAVFARGPGGERPVRFVGTLQDITKRKAVEERLRSSDARLRLAVDAAQIGVWRIDDGGLHTTPELLGLLGFAEDAEPSLEEIRARYLPGELEKMRAAASAALDRGERHFESEIRIRRPDGEVRWLLMRADVTRQPNGRARAGVGVMLDITDRKEAEDRVRLLAREVDHRANNLLTVIQATIALTKADSVEALKTILTGRISALAHAHQLLADARWEGADLRRLAEEELRPYRLGEVERATIVGAPVALPPQAAQSLAIALHELATNAAKHGALSMDGGRVALEWRGDGRNEPLVIRWGEHDGPPVRTPTRYGLGVRVVERALGGSLGGEVTFDWRPDGLVCELRLPGEARRGGG